MKNSKPRKKTAAPKLTFKPRERFFTNIEDPQRTEEECAALAYFKEKFFQSDISLTGVAVCILRLALENPQQVAGWINKFANYRVAEFDIKDGEPTIANPTIMRTEDFIRTRPEYRKQLLAMKK